MALNTLNPNDLSSSISLMMTSNKLPQITWIESYIMEKSNKPDVTFPRDKLPPCRQWGSV